MQLMNDYHVLESEHVCVCCVCVVCACVCVCVLCVCDCVCCVCVCVYLIIDSIYTVVCGWKLGLQLDHLRY